MRAECIDAVSRALGRQITQAEATNIEARILQAMRKLANQGRANWVGMTEGDRFMAAADMAARNVAADAALKRRRVALTALRHDAVKNYLDNNASRFKEGIFTVGGEIEALERVLAFHSDGQSGNISIESMANAIRDDALGSVLEAIDTTKGGLLGVFTSKQGVLDLVTELRGGDSGNPLARTGAKQYAETAERLRQRFNRAGGNIGRLEDWGMPQSHSQHLVAKAGKDRWVADVLGKVDRERYTNPNGTLMDDTQLTEFLKEAWNTIATNGANKIEPGKPAGSGMRGNRGSTERQIHFKDAESYIEYQRQYSETPMLQSMLNHIDMMARDIALVEALGPNPNNMMQYWIDLARKNMIERDPIISNKINNRATRLETLYNEISGARSLAVSDAVASTFDTYRALNVASRLGSAAITAISDIGTQTMTSIYNGIPVTRLYMNELRSLNPASATDRRTALRAGLGIQQLIGSMNRWGVDGLQQDAHMSGRVSRYAQGAAAGLMKFSGLNALSRAGQQAYASVMMDSLGEMSRTLGSMSDAKTGQFRRLAERAKEYGVTEVDFSVWRLAQPEDWRGLGDTVLTAQSIYRIPDIELKPIADQAGVSTQALRDQSATRMMAFVNAETSMAVIETPTANERVAIYGRWGKERGSLPTELYRSAMQFKSFPIAIMMRHGKRSLGQATGVGKASYIAGLVALTSVFGGLAVQVNEVASGRDPLDMTDPRFAGRAFLKGGALGLYADFLFSDQTQYGSSIAGAIGGPILSDADDFLKLTMGNIQRTVEGKDTDTGARAVRMLKGKVPFANLWYTKAATDRMIFNQLQEMASPGYLRRMERRARKEFSQEYFASPDGRRLRAPNLGRAVNQ